VQGYLDDLANLQGDSPSEPVVRKLLARAVDRLHRICGRLLHRSYPRLMRGPLNLQPEELLSAIVERMIKSLRGIRPRNAREFFALAMRHMRWELNDMARRLDEQAYVAELRESREQVPLAPSVPTACSNMQRILDAIESLPEDEREVFHLVRIQGMTKPEAASVIGVSARTVHRRMNRGLMRLAQSLGDLVPSSPSPPGAV